MSALWACLAVFASVATDPPPRPTIHDRFAIKERSAYVHIGGTLHLRNDFYDSTGGSLEAGYYLSESLALEVRGLLLRTRLSAAARQVKRDTGFTPDAQAQHNMLTFGARYSIGYGKVLAFGSFVFHFDPQLVLHGGVATTDTRVLPTLLFSLSLLTHLRWGLQIKLDMGMSAQIENRRRGWITTLGFIPLLSIGWSLRPESTAEPKEEQTP